MPPIRPRHHGDIYDKGFKGTLTRARALRTSVRPKFLAFLSVSASPTLSCRAAHVDQNTVYRHRQRDPEFAEQWTDACRIAIDLLEARVFQRAVEGDLEPIHYMGVVVDYVRKFDSKLQIELLRAKRPDTFKTPGTNVNIGTRGDIFVLTEEQRHELIRINREYLESTPVPIRELPPSQVVPQEPQRLTNGETNPA